MGTRPYNRFLAPSFVTVLRPQVDFSIPQFAWGTGLYSSTPVVPVRGIPKKENAPAFAAKRRNDFCDSLRQDTNGVQVVVFVLALSADSGHLPGALARLGVTVT